MDFSDFFIVMLPIVYAYLPYPIINSCRTKSMSDSLLGICYTCLGNSFTISE